jgi:uncharacterized protein
LNVAALPAIFSAHKTEAEMNDMSARGRFVWYDLMTSDPGKAQDFYKSTAGWGTEDWNGGGGEPYTMWTANGKPMGGVMKNSTPAPPHWIAYIAVPDTDATTKQVTSLGGRVLHGPEDIPTVGRFAVLADPQGAAFCAFTPSRESQSKDELPPIGEFSWHELATDDLKAAWTFYETVFGWDKIAEHDMGPMGIYLIFGRNGHQLGGMFNKPPDMKMPSNWLQYIRVDSADRVADVVKANGGTVMNGPMEVPGGDRIAQCMDPQGAAFAIHSTKA